MTDDGRLCIMILVVRTTALHIAGWSSLAARRSHNPKVIGSNSTSATYAQIAQLVEQSAENPRVAGSIPALGILNAEGCLEKNLAFKM